MRIKLTLFVILLAGMTLNIAAQSTLSGTITDANSGEPLIGASILVKGTTTGTVTEFDGTFELTVDGLPVILQISYIGFESTEREVSSAGEPLDIQLGDNAVTANVVIVEGRRISERQQQNPQTVETLDAIAIKETPAASFYDGLGNLKDVDLTAASLGFKIVNTRGFNSTNPVRSLQIIDGVDNQSPGLNFSLGNFLGASELDINRVNLVVGASSAFFGPNAFNGVIAMETKDPFLQKGLSATVKTGSRNLIEGGFRWADAVTNDEGYEWMAYKINAYGFRADDWVADNFDPVFGTTLPADNPGGYDAVNIYGDENNGAFNFTNNRRVPGLGEIRRQGYREEDLVDYDTENIKASAAIHFRLNPERTLASSELIVASNYSTGTTVFQGDNRFSLRDIQFFQHRLELRKRDDYFIRAYVTHEDAGNSYDPYFTAIRLQDLHKTDGVWASSYSAYWQGTIVPRFEQEFPDTWPDCFPQSCNLVERDQQRREFLQRDDVQAVLQEWHAEARDVAQQGTQIGTNDFYEVGTDRFQRAFDSITSTLANEGGTRFFDRSALYHIHGEKTFRGVGTADSENNLDLTIGANGRLFTPNSRGTILLDTMGRNIDTWEVGVYGGGTYRIGNDWKLSASLRLDKNQNFEPLLSPALSVVYTPGENSNTVLRAGFNSAIRNPTLNDQYLFYNVGRAILIGNLDGVENLATVPSVRAFANTGVRDSLDFFDVAPIRPEKVRTVELGARTIIGDKLYLDATYYYSFYRDFIGFNLGVDVRTNGPNITAAQAFRVSANATDAVTTQGFSIGSNYYFGDYFSLNANYSWNVLNTDTDDPIIPAFNTPEHKYNVGLGGRDVPVNFLGSAVKDFGFNFNWKWVDGFLFEGSPQFTGLIEAYGMLDGQVNFDIEGINTTIKLGATNLLDNQVFQVYGGPRIGRFFYVSATYNWQKK